MCLSKNICHANPANGRWAHVAAAVDSSSPRGLHGNQSDFMQDYASQTVRRERRYQFHTHSESGIKYLRPLICMKNTFSVVVDESLRTSLLSRLVLLPF
jgi:hypothetical protein